MSSVGNRDCRVNSYQLSTMQVVRRRTARHRQSSDLGAATMHRTFAGCGGAGRYRQGKCGGLGQLRGVEAAWVRLLRMGRHQFSGEPNDQVSRR